MLGIRRHNREQALADALAASLDAVRDGTASIDQCLAEHPEFAAELEPLLLTAAHLAVAGRIQPSETAREQARFALLRAAAVSSRPVPIAPRAVVRRRSWLALAPAAVAALLFAAIAVPVLGSVDTNAVPGNWNYSFKRATERVRLALATDSTDRRLLRLEFAQRRLNEIERLSSQGHVENHASEVTSLLKDYTADLNQVTNTTQAQGQIPPAVQQQIEALTPRADAVIQPIVQNTADNKTEVKSAAQDAAVVTRQAQSVAQTLPTTSTAARVSPATQSQATPQSASANPTVRSAGTVTPTPATPAPAETVMATPTPTPVDATVIATSSTATVTATAPATATVTSTPSVAETEATTPVRAATITTTPAPQQPAPTAVAASLTPTPIPPPAVTTPQAVSTREAAVLTPVTPSPVSAGAVRTATATAGVEETAAPATPTVTPLVPVGTAAVRPSATPTPVTPPRPASPSPLATRPASVESGLVVVGRSPDEVRYQWTGPADSLTNVIAPLGSSVVYVTYQTGTQPAALWYPGTPAPVISTGQLITVKLKTLGTPANRSSTP